MTKRTKPTDTARSPKSGFHAPSVIINMAAGSASDITSEIKAIFSRLSFAAPKVHLMEPEQLAGAFDTIKTDGTDLLIVYGGDGTCKAGAIAAQEAGIALVALPGGTMNMLPKALYGTDDWETALELALSQDAPRYQAAGIINDHVFFCGAILGEPILMSEARESLRDGEIVDAVKHIPDIVTAIKHGEEFDFKVDGKTFDKEANGLQLYCPFMTEGATVPDAFEIASVPQLSMSDLIGIGAIALTQDWRDSALVKTAFGRRVEITGQGAFDILVDGEPERVKCPITIKLVPEGVSVLAPDLHTKA